MNKHRVQPWVFAALAWAAVCLVAPAAGAEKQRPAGPGRSERDRRQDSSLRSA